jgi:hypothetical protein
MAGWIPYISQRLFLNMDEKKIDDKYVAAAYRAWNGVRINWAEILIVSIRKEISRKKTRNPMLLLSAGYLNVYCKPHIKINLEVVPLCVKEPGEETNSQTRPDGASGPSSKVSTPVTRGKAKMLDIRAEDMEIDPPHSMDGVGSTDPPEDWTIVSRGTKRHREGKEGQMDFTGKGAEDDKREEEERLDKSTRKRRIVTTVTAEGRGNFQVKEGLGEYEASASGSDSERKGDFSSIAARIEDVSHYDGKQ